MLLRNHRATASGELRHCFISPKKDVLMEYKVVIYQEGMLGSLLLGASKVNPVKFTEFLNRHAAEGWRVQTMEKDQRRMLLFWSREAYVVILGREA